MFNSTTDLGENYVNENLCLSSEETIYDMVFLVFREILMQLFDYIFELRKKLSQSGA